MLDELKKAAAALDKGKTNEALDALLAAWRVKRAPELADANSECQDGARAHRRAVR